MKDHCRRREREIEFVVKLDTNGQPFRVSFPFSSLIYDQTGLTSDKNCEMKLDKHPRPRHSCFWSNLAGEKVESHDVSEFQ